MQYRRWPLTLASAATKLLYPRSVTHTVTVSVNDSLNFIKDPLRGLADKFEVYDL